MNIIKYNDRENIEQAIAKDEPLLAAISFDGETAVVAHVDEAVEHHILLNKAGLGDTNIDKYFRIIFDKEGCDWTFICPPDYKNIKYRDRRVAEFYKDGFAAIADFLSQMGYYVDINIPKRYRRHFESLGE